MAEDQDVTTEEDGPWSGYSSAPTPAQEEGPWSQFGAQPVGGEETWSPEEQARLESEQAPLAPDTGIRAGLTRLRQTPFARRLMGPTQAEQEAGAGTTGSPGEIASKFLQFTTVPPQIAKPIRAVTQAPIEMLPPALGGVAKGVQELALNFPMAPLPLAPRAGMAAFGGQYLSELPEARQAYRDALERGDTKEAISIATQTVGGGALLAAGGAHEALRPRERTPNAIPKREAASVPVGEAPGDSGEVGARGAQQEVQPQDAQAQAKSQEGNAAQEQARVLLTDQSTKAEQAQWSKATENLSPVDQQRAAQSAQKPLDWQSFALTDKEGYQAVDPTKVREAVKSGQLSSDSPTDALLNHLLEPSEAHPLESIRIGNFTPDEWQAITQGHTPFEGRFSQEPGKRSALIELMLKRQSGKPISQAEFVQTLTHELVHNNVTSKLKDAPQEIRGDADKLFDFVKKAGDGTEFADHNALSNVHELFAEITDPKVRDWLASLDYSKDIRKAKVMGTETAAISPPPIRQSALGKFLEIAKKLLKLPDVIKDAFGREVDAITALDQITSLSSRLEKVQRGVSEGGETREAFSKADDVERYKEVQDKLAEGIKKGEFDTPEFQKLWKESEDIKNRHGGSPPGPGIAGMGAATPQQFPGPATPVRNAMNTAARGLSKARATVANLWARGNVRDAISYMRDRGYTQAAVFARRMANDVSTPMREAVTVRPSAGVSQAQAARQTAENLKMAPEALTFFREAGGNPEELTRMRDTLVNSQRADPGARRKAVDAIDWALYHQDELAALSDRYEEITRNQVAAENAAGMDTPTRQNYVMHAQDLDVPEDFLSKGGGTDPTGFRKQREFNTYADSIASGYRPKSLNAVDLLESRLRYGQQAINTRAWVDGLRTMTDPRSGQPIGTGVQVITRPDGTSYQQSPPGYHTEQAGRQPIAVLNGYEGLFHSLTDQSFWTKSLGGRSLLKANAVGKSVSLMFDTFHLGRVAFWQSLIKGLGVSTFEAPFPSYKKGMTLLDHTPEQIREMGRRREIPQDWVNTLVQDRRKLDLAIDTGFNVGGIADALHSDLVHSIPVVGTFNKWLFQKFQRGAMTEAWLLEYDRLKNARPNMPDETAARQVSKDLNTRFGNLGRQGIFKSKSAQDTARLIALAPQWNEGLIRSELGAIKQLGQGAIDVARGRRIYAGTLGRSVAAMALAQFAANQIINYVTRGKPTWENEEEGLGAKLSAWIPDKIGKGPGFFLHPLGLAAETTHLLMQKYEKTEDFGKTLNAYARSRSSSAMKPILTFMTQKDTLGRAIRPDNLWGEIVKSAVPAPIGGSAIGHAGKQVVSGEPSEAFPGQFQKQALASVGVKTEGAPSAEQRIRALATKFNKAKGITPSAEFYVGDYEPLTKALAIGNKTDAKEALREILKKKEPEQIIKHYKLWSKHPFTGQKARENEFRESLSFAQNKAYEQAKEERQRILALFLGLLEE